MVNIKWFHLVLALIAIVVYQKLPAQVDVRSEILNHGKIIRQAFADSDIAKIRDLHHPEVIKALGYNNVQIGREKVIKGLTDILENYTLEFVTNEIEDILIQDHIVIEQTKFSIKGTPKNEGNPFVFSGRTMVTYMKNKNSPTGWVTIREIIQPAKD